MLKFLLSLFLFKKDEEFDKQIQQYDTLKIYQSYRGLAALTIICPTILFPFIVMYLSWDAGHDISEGFIMRFMLFAIITMAVLSFFVYKGNKFVILLLLILGFFSMLDSVFGTDTEDPLIVNSAIIEMVGNVMFVVTTFIFIRVLQVENKRKNVQERFEAMKDVDDDM